MKVQSKFMTLCKKQMARRFDGKTIRFQFFAKIILPNKLAARA